MPGPNKNRKGFTLLELMIVIAIIGILASIAQPMYHTAVTKAREASLREDLFNLRSVIDQHFADHGKYPENLDDLVSRGYMRGIPKDPFTGDNNWSTDPPPDFSAENGGGSEEESGGIYDVHSLSDKTGLNGVPYSEW